MNLQKDKPWRSAPYLKYVRSLPCSACGTDQEIQAHHVREIGTGGGTGLKPSDCYTIPLCAECHSEVHRDRFYVDQFRVVGLVMGEAVKSGVLGVL